MTFTYQHTCEDKTVAGALPAVQEEMRRFRRDAKARLAGKLAPMTASCADGPVTEPVTFTFGETELRAWAEAGVPGFAVHHGARAKAPGLGHAKLLSAHVVPFTSVRPLPLRLTYAALGHVLAGTASDWGMLGQQPGPIKILAHGAALNRRVLEVVLGLAGLSIAADVQWHPSYGQLARAAERVKDSIVLGLRPEHADGVGLSPVLLDGALPWRCDGVAARYSLPVDIVWRDSLSHAGATAISQYLMRVRRNLAADALVMSRMERSSYDTDDRLSTAA